METAGDGRAPNESGRAGEKLRKRPSQTENSTGMSSDQGGNFAATGISELEQMFKQVTDTRFRIQQEVTMENLPDEIILNIFIRLLAKQLVQIRSVCKSWNALLSHPSFIKSHLHRSIHNNNDHHFLLAFHDYCERLTQYSCQSSHLEPTTFIKHTSSTLPMTVIGAINGLICLSKPSYSDIHIWNPSLSAVSTIPPPHSMLPRLHYETSIRFGFDPKTDDYKLVKLTGLRDTANGFGSVKEWVQVEVYRMRKRSWEFITQPFPSHITRIKNTDYLCVDGHDGHLHWENKIEETIVAFDLGSETFREILLPDSILDSNHRFHRLVVLGGKLCEISCRYDGAWEVWVMEEYGVPQSWVKRHVFPKFTFASWRLPFGFTSRNELLHVDEDAQLVLYDLVANKTKLTPTKLIANKIVEYVDSLVWV